MNKAVTINCPTCNHTVSRSAMTCPSCGAVLRKAKRGFFGKLIMLAFWGFNALMALWLYGGTQAAMEGSEALTGAEQVGAAIGTGLGVTLILAIWFFGAILLGLMALITRPRG